jgi:F plasmid transfer operon, TraF, protein
MKLRPLTLCVAISAVSMEALAGTPRFLDARAFAMGGVGVTAARPAAASFYNPALLAIERKEKNDDFGMLLPSVAVIASDEDELIDTADEFEEKFLIPFEDSINNFSAADLTNSRAELALQATRIKDELTRINQDQALIDVGLGLSFQVPSQEVAAGVFASGVARVLVTTDFRDEALLQTIIDGANGYNNPGDVPYDLSQEDMKSTVRAVGASTAQAGVSLASTFELSGHNVAIGVSPKVVALRAYDRSYDVDNFDEFDGDDLKDSKVSKSGFNFDLGAAAFLDRDRRWMAGLSVQNIIPMSVKTADRTILGTPNNPGDVEVKGREIELKPSASVGLSYAGDAYIVAADLDLTKTEALMNEDDSQHIGIGAEYDLFESVQFRFGVRHNLAGDPGTMFTTGFGLNILGATVELAAMSDSGSDTVGAALQLGATF